MMKMHLNPHRMEQHNQKVKHFSVLTFFLFSVLVSQSPAVVSNWVDGVAYGPASNIYTAVSIASITNAAGSLVIGNADTDTLTLNHEISGFISVTNGFNNFEINSTTNAVVSSGGNAVLYVNGGSNLTVTGGDFIGKTGSPSGQPPIPGADPFGSAVGGFITNSHDAIITGAKFSGAVGVEGLVVTDSSLTINNATVRGGNGGSAAQANGAAALVSSGTELTIMQGTFAGGGAGRGGNTFGGAALLAENNSMVTIHDGSFTGGAGNTAFYLENSSATVSNGTFVGNVNGTGKVAGDGLFSQLTGATTNQVNLQGGDFSSLAFYGVNGSIQNFTAGTNLTVQNGIIQNGGTVVVDNQADSALTDITILSGTMAFDNAFNLLEDGRFILGSQKSQALFGDLDVNSNATFDVGLGQLKVANLTLHSTSLLDIDIAATTQGFVTTDSTYFHTNSMIAVDATATGFSSGINDFVILSASTSNQLFTIGGGFTNVATSADFTTNNVTAAVAGRTFLNGVTVENGQLLNMQFSTKGLQEYWNVSGQMSILAGELDNIDYRPMMAVIDNINNPTLSAAAVERTYFTALNTFQTALLGLQAALGQSASRGTDFREQLKLIPAGAKGPARNNDIRGWGKYYGQFYSHDRDGVNSGYDTTLQGGVLGVDMSFDNLLIGISGGAGTYSSDADDYDAKEDTDAAHGSVYATYGMEQGYLDAGVAYGYNRVKIKTGGPFKLDGDFDAQLLSAYFGGGYDFVDPKSATVFTPEASIQYTTYEQDSYTETSANAVPREIDSFDADSLRSSIGLNMTMISTTRFETFGYKIDTRFHWMHEFNTDPDDLKFNLEGGSNGYQITYPELDADLFRAGFGVTFFNTKRTKPKNVLLRIDFDELFGDGFNSHNISAKVVYAF